MTVQHGAQEKVNPDASLYFASAVGIALAWQCGLGVPDVRPDNDHRLHEQNAVWPYLHNGNRNKYYRDHNGCKSLPDDDTGYN
jgi:hypothetical protein